MEHPRGLAAQTVLKALERYARERRSGPGARAMIEAARLITRRQIGHRDYAGAAQILREWMAAQEVRR